MDIKRLYGRNDREREKTDITDNVLMPVWNLPLYLEQERGKGYAKYDEKNRNHDVNCSSYGYRTTGCSKEAAVETDPSAGSFYTSRSHYTDPYYVHRALEVLRYEYEQNILTKEQVIAQLDVLSARSKARIALNSIIRI